MLQNYFYKLSYIKNSIKIYNIVKNKINLLVFANYNLYYYNIMITIKNILREIPNEYYVI
jgi:hypothetical protein